MSKYMQYAMVAAQEALEDAGWSPHTEHEEEMTVSSHQITFTAFDSFSSTLRVCALAQELGASKRPTIPLLRTTKV